MHLIPAASYAKRYLLKKDIPMHSSLLEEMKKFANRKFLLRKNLVQYHNGDSWPFIHIEDPTVLARFAAHIKQTVYKRDINGWVYFRGQCTHHKSMTPSLFRGSNQDYPVTILLKAQSRLIEKIKSNFAVKRFQNDDLPALIQHYGIKTSWLDLVDNLYIAIWFATNSTEYGKPRGSLIVNKSNEKFGWIYFIANSDFNASLLRHVDLRTNQHSLSVRPHAQHGISVTRPHDLWEGHDRDLKDFVVAKIRFPVSEKWLLSGYMASSSYLFPSSYFDNTLKNLRQDKMMEIISEGKFELTLPEGTLGCINWVT